MSKFILSESHRVFNRAQKSRKLKPEEFDAAMFYFNGAWTHQQKKIDELESEFAGYQNFQRERRLVKALNEALEFIKKEVPCNFENVSTASGPGSFHSKNCRKCEWLEQNSKEEE